MNWFEWIMLAFGALVAVDVVFVCALITISWAKERRGRR